MIDAKLINIKQDLDNAILKKEQKKFNKLSAQIGEKKILLQEFQQVSMEYNSRYNKDLVPILNKHNKRLVEMLVFIDRHYDDVIFSKTDCKRLDSIIYDVSLGLIEEYAEVKQIYNRRFGVDCNTQQSIEVKSGLEENIEPEFLHTDEFQPPKTSKKSTKELKREAKEQHDVKEMSKSIKDIYRQLAKDLHPDRIANDSELEYKTSLMKRVNIAYEKQDLLTLLEIQIEIQQINQNSINNLALNKIKHFNKILENQLDELEQEIYTFSGHFIINGAPMNKTANPKSILFALTHDISQVKTMLKDLSYDLSLWKQDIRYLKQYIKNMRI